MNKCQVQPGPKQEFYSIEAAAAYLTIGTTTIYKAVQQRQIKHARFGKSIRISHENLIHWVEEQTKPTLSEVKIEALRKQKIIIRTSRPTKSAGRIIQTSNKKHMRQIWPPTTVTDLQILAHRIEARMLAEEASSQ